MNNKYIISLFKGKGSALNRGNYCCLKKLSGNVIDAMQFGFIPGQRTTDIIFIVRQFQEKFLDKNKNLYFGFIDLEKVFNRVPHKVQ